MSKKSRGRRSLHLRATFWSIGITGAILLLGALTVYEAEKGAPGANIKSFPDALWWSVETATTVGYGDLYPVTWLGRLAATVVMVNGIAMFGVLTAAIATWFVARVDRERREAARVEQEEAALLREIHSFHGTLDQLERVITKQESA